MHEFSVPEDCAAWAPLGSKVGRKLVGLLAKSPNDMFHLMRSMALRASWGNTFFFSLARVHVTVYRALQVDARGVPVRVGLPGGRSVCKLPPRAPNALARRCRDGSRARAARGALVH